LRIKIPQPNIVLGSSSPRRKDLLSVLGLTYAVVKPETPEIVQPGEEPEAYVKRNAKEKCDWVCSSLAQSPIKTAHGSIVICADTIVVLGSTILEKPCDSDHAAQMLQALSGNYHNVFTGVCVRSIHTERVHSKEFVTATKVRIKALSEREIRNYISTGEPFDKAGGYAAQGIGSYMVEAIEGSYTNVVGLPVAELVECLEKDFNFSIWNT